jgi:hypothetical protein
LLILSFFNLRALIDGGEDLVAKILSELTGGLFNVSSGTLSEFDVGPIGDFGGKIEGLLDKFGLDFGSFISDFKADYTSFSDNLVSQSNVELPELISLKPPSLARFGNLLQIGSKKPSPQFSLPLKEKLWNKLHTTFPSYLYNGVPVPGLSLGVTFQEAYPTPGDFPVRDFLLALAVAYGKAPSFSDVRAQSFSIGDLFTPEFGPSLSASLLEKLQNTNVNAPSLASIFSRFDVVDDITGLPMVSLTKELFDVNAYLPEIQVALQLAPSVDLTAKNFGANDIQEALFPFPVPTLQSFASFIKRQIIPKITDVLDFDVSVGTSKSPAGGLTLDVPTLSANGLDFGTFSTDSTQLFPPSIDIDDVQVSSMVTVSP